MRGEKSCSVGIEAGIATGPAILMEPTQADGLASVLSQAHYDAPQFRYMIPDERARLRLLPALFSIAIRACQVHGRNRSAPRCNVELSTGVTMNLSVGSKSHLYGIALRANWTVPKLLRTGSTSRAPRSRPGPTASSLIPHPNLGHKSSGCRAATRQSQRTGRFGSSGRGVG